MSDLHAAARDYLAIRRALGFKLRGHDQLLDDYLAFLAEVGAPTITTATAVAWATRPAELQPVRYAQRLCAVRGFAGYVHALDTETEIPPAGLLPYRRERPNPFLYSQAHIDALVAATSQLRPALRAATYCAVFGLLAVTGMRVGEAIALDEADVDLDAGVVGIREAKFGKHRLLPIHSTTVAALRDYIQVRNRLCCRPREPSFFISTRGTRLLYECVHTTFGQLLALAAITAPTGSANPTIHGLRHSFAVATLRDWYRDEADITAKLPVLSAYLGHVQPASTYWYLSSTLDLLAAAADRLEQAAGGLR